MLGSNSRYHAKMYNHSESCCCVFKTETVEISWDCKLSAHDYALLVAAETQYPQPELRKKLDSYIGFYNIRQAFLWLEWLGRRRLGSLVSGPAIFWLLRRLSISDAPPTKQTSAETNRRRAQIMDDDFRRGRSPVVEISTSGGGFSWDMVFGQFSFLNA